MEPAVDWTTPSDPLVFADGEIHLWRVPLEQPEMSIEALAAVLSVEEIARADRFVSPSDKTNFIAGRCTLRMLLGRYLGLPPAQVPIETAAFGKPVLSRASGKPALQFNLSHSHGLALYVFTQQGRVGIDLEKIRAAFATPDLAKHSFSQREQEELSRLPAEARLDGFFRCWTLKESYVKARGEGLQIPLDSFDVPITPEGPSLLRAPDGRGWTLFSFYPAPGYVAALAAEGEIPGLRFYGQGKHSGSA